MDTKITMDPIGVIHTPYKTTEGMPIQGAFEEKVTGKIEVFQEYKKGLKDVEGFSHLILVFTKKSLNPWASFQIRNRGFFCCIIRAT